MTGGHRLRLGEDFDVWTTMCVRTAGLPYDWVTDPDAHREPLFREALTWQSPTFVRMLRRGHRPSWARQRDRTLAGYRSRYCAKNDSIGFFGPVSWGLLTDGDTKVGELPPVPRGPVCLEVWAVQAVADALVHRHGLADWTVPRRSPAVAQTDDGVLLADGSALPLSPLRQLILGLADGVRTVADILAEAADVDPGSAPRLPAELAALRAMGVLTGGIHVPKSRTPERQLAVGLSRVADPARRAAATTELRELLAARDRLAGSLGDPEAVATGLDELDAVFTRVADVPAQRRAGEFYAGRSVAYEDCVSQFTPTLGSDVLTPLAPALSLLLRSARWLSVRVAGEYTALARDLLAADPRPDGYPLAALLRHLLPTFTDRDGPAARAGTELARRWTALLALPEGARSVRRCAADLEPAVREAFPAQAPGWPSARWHSPDLMLAATDTEALRRGDFLAVLGELHPTANTTDQLFMHAAHPKPAVLRGYIDDDMPYRVVPQYLTTDPLVNSRTAPPDAHHSANYTYLGTGNQPGYGPARARQVPLGALRVHDEDGALVVRSLTDDFTADLPAVLDEYLSMATYNRFDLIDAPAYRPRVQIDGLVVARERWRVPLRAFAARDGLRLPAVLALVRELVEREGLPNPSFWVVSGERKPLYVDVTDPGLVDAAWAKVRRSRERDPDGRVDVSEMLPGPDGLWLRDALGRRYTSEFRLVCVDREAYRPAGPTTATATAPTTTAEPTAEPTAETAER